MNPLDDHIHRALVDRLIELYCDWRTECWQVRATYDRACDAPASDSAVAFAAYAAALDREQSACDAYAAQVRLVQSLFVEAETREPAGDPAP